jgi:hypothetical protein
MPPKVNLSGFLCFREPRRINWHKQAGLPRRLRSVSLEATHRAKVWFTTKAAKGISVETKEPDGLLPHDPHGVSHVRALRPL